MFKERKRGKIIALCGISGSGKSTKAREIHKSNEGSVIVSRDGLRRLIFGLNDYNIKEFFEDVDNRHHNENIVDRYHKTMVYETLEKGNDVILDETHVLYKHLEPLSYWNVPVELVMVDCDLKVAIDRDSKRLQPVGESTIKKQHMRYQSLKDRLEKFPIDFTTIPYPKHDDTKKGVYIFDIDGTLAHMGDRIYYEMSKVDRDEYDTPTMILFEIYKEKTSVNNVILCSGRSESSRELTKKWLIDAGVRNVENIRMYFRKDGDMRPDWMVKQEMWSEIQKFNNIIGMFDDRLQVTRRARMLGHKVFSVDYNNF